MSRAKGTSFKPVIMFSKLRSALPCHCAGRASLTGVAEGSLAQPPPQKVWELQLQLGAVDGKAAALS